MKEDAIKFVLDDKKEKLLAGRLWCMYNGNQLGNQVYEILGFTSIAKKVGRRPTILLQSDPFFNVAVIQQIWNSLLYFPHIFDGFYLETDKRRFQVESIPLLRLEREQPTKYHDLIQLEELKDEPIVNLEVDLLQNYRYLDEMGQAEVKSRLRFSNSTLELLKFLVPFEFYKKKTRRTDFWELATEFPDIIKALKFVKKRDKLLNDFAVVIFTDDLPYVAWMAQKKGYSEFRDKTWFPKAVHPIHFVWAFLSNHCTHILLTRIQSTFGFLGAYLAAEDVQVFFNPAKTMNFTVPTPKSWIPIK